MKKVITLLFFLIFSTCYTQNIDKLKNNNGFRDIKLGSSINNYPDFIKKNTENEEYFGAWGWDYDYFLNNEIEKLYSKLGESNIYKFFIKVDNSNSIYKISLVLEKTPEVIQMLEYVYGKPTFENNELGLKDWVTDNDIKCELLATFNTYMYITYTKMNLKNKTLQEDELKKRSKAISEF